MPTKIIAWNINGIKAQLKKENLFDLIEKENPNIICFGETKISCSSKEKIEEEMRLRVKGYKYRYWSPCIIKNGYSGTAILSKRKPLSVNVGLGKYGEDDQLTKKKSKSLFFDDEGRVITLEFKDYYLVHVYTPNSGQGLKRLDYRVNKWDKEFSKYCGNLQKKKPIIICGDLNVANEEIDIANPKGNKKNSGFTIEERDSFKKMLSDLKLIDTFRNKYPEEVKYSFWTYMMNARKRNKGWRIDYFLVSEKLLSKVSESNILTDIMGSDHAPIILKLK